MRTKRAQHRRAVLAGDHRPVEPHPGAGVWDVEREVNAWMYEPCPCCPQPGPCLFCGRIISGWGPLCNSCETNNRANTRGFAPPGRADGIQLAQLAGRYPAELTHSPWEGDTDEHPDMTEWRRAFPQLPWAS